MKKKFLEYASCITRPGIEQVLNFLETSDFYTAPASTIYHGNFEGGLVEHSVHVYEELYKLNKMYGSYNIETLAIVSLFHDLCKINTYSIGTRNVKNETSGKWETKPFFKKKEQNPFGGHGSKSVYLLMQYTVLNYEEASAINCHMGPWDRQDYGNPGEVFEKNLLAWMLHVADERATYYRDRKEML